MTAKKKMIRKVFVVTLAVFAVVVAVLGARYARAQTAQTTAIKLGNSLATVAIKPDFNSALIDVSVITKNYSQPVKIWYSKTINADGSLNSPYNKVLTLTSQGYYEETLYLLEYNTTYYYGITGGDSNQPLTDVGSFTTLNQTPNGGSPLIGGKSVVIGNVTTYDTSAVIEGQVITRLAAPLLILFGPSNALSLPGGQAVIVGPSGYFSVEIPNLLPSTNYTFEAVTAQAGGNLALSPLQNFTTKSELVYLDFNSVTQTTAQIVGRISVKNTGMVIAVDKGGDGTFSYQFTPTPDDNLGNFHSIISGLIPNTTYSFMAAKPTTPLITRLTGVRQFSTLPVQVTPYVDSVTSTSAVIGARVSPGVLIPTVIVYSKQTPLTPAGNSALTLSVSDGVYRSGTISGLQPNTTYYYQIFWTEGSSGGATNPVQQKSTIIAFSTSASPQGAPPAVPQIKSGGTAVNAVTYDGKSIVQCLGGLNANKQQGCSFSDVIALINRIINFLLFLVAPIIMTIMLLWAGVLILTSGGSAENVSKAKGMLFKAIIGIIIAMAAWIIVKFIMVGLGYNTTIFPSFY